MVHAGQPMLAYVTRQLPVCTMNVAVRETTNFNNTKFEPTDNKI